MSKALLTGTVGGIVGTITSAIGVIWIFILNEFLAELYKYLNQAFQVYAFFINPVLRGHYTGPPPIPFFPSWNTFVLSSFILAIFLVVTSILIGIGFYGAYKIGGGASGLAGLVLGVIGTASGALLIIIGNLSEGYISTTGEVALGATGKFSLPTINFPLIGLGFLILGFTFVLLGAATISVREMTDTPSTSYAAGILSIVAAVFFILGGLLYIILIMVYIILIMGFGLIFSAFILWAWVFYSSRNL